ncbi:hypothetical protein C6P40_001705, partial [Pichia californica]
MSKNTIDVSNSDLSFNSDVMGSIQSSVNFKKPLMMYIKDPLQTDAGNNNGSPDSDSWINKIIFSNTTLSHFTRQLIVSDFIRLQIVKNSIDFNNLVSIMPSFQNTPTPCIVFIFSGQIIDIFPTDIDVNIVDDKIKTIHSNLQNISGKINAQQ